jgi:hypothetical protein
MGLCSDVIGCMYCLCKPCWEDGEADVARGRRGDRALKDKLKDKVIKCEKISERYLRINLFREQNGDYFKPGWGGREKLPKNVLWLFEAIGSVEFIEIFAYN